MSEDDIAHIEGELRRVLPDWVAGVDRVAASRIERPLLTTFESFAGMPNLVHDALAYAQARNVDVLMAAHSAGDFY